MKPSYSYFRIASKYNEYKGQRFFRVDIQAPSVVQVCVNPGKEGRGRGNTFGVYPIAKASFFSNYLGMGYVEPCSKAEYTKSFKTVVKYLE